jgi:hypothetical protein
MMLFPVVAFAPQLRAGLCSRGRLDDHAAITPRPGQNERAGHPRAFDRMQLANGS